MIKMTAAIGLMVSICSAETKVEIGKYQIDSMHSKVGFEVSHLVISTVEGSFKEFSGDVELDSDFTKSKVSTDVEINSIDTGVSKRDDHLKSADFFDAKNHSKMTFKSTQITGTPEAFKLIGDLTIRGKKKSVTFDGKYLGAVTDGYGNRKVAFKATTKISRKEFGLKWSSTVEAGPVVGDEVTISLNIQAGKVVPKEEPKKAPKK
jgi:polyisoprenoid-binding protein YceI